MSDRNSGPQTAVWYFVGATFIFAAPNLYFRDAELPWLLPVTMAVGFGVFACGVVVLVSELRQGRRARIDPGRDAQPQPTESREPSGAAPVHTPLISLAATFAAVLAVIGCLLTVLLQLPLAAELMIIFVSVLLLAGSGALIGIVITRGRTQSS